MNKTLGRLTTATLFLLLTIGCTNSTKTITKAPEQQPTPVVSASDANQFRTLSTQRTGGVEVVCHNCRAHFKLSQQIQKMSMKGDAVVDCPVCHKNYLK